MKNMRGCTIFVTLISALSLTAQQPSMIGVSGCGTSIFNGNYNIMTPGDACVNGCIPYEKTDGTVWVYRFDGNDALVVGNTVLNCFSVLGVLLSEETDCDPTNGGTSIEGCLITEGPLAVDLLSFEGEARSNNMHLTWQTASEINHSGFEIQRSDDGILFKTVSFVEGQGSADSKRHYAYRDENLPYGPYYYRLKMMDMDGRAQFSNIITTWIGGETTMALLFPNYVSNGQTRLDINVGSAGQIRLIVRSFAGQIVWSEAHFVEAGVNSLNLDLRGLAAGIFVVQIDHRQGRIYKRIVVQ